MRLTKYFLPTLKETPAEAQIVSHRLMLRAGLICQQSAGIYNWLPLGLRVLQKVSQIVRDEQNAIGCHEVLTPIAQSADLWHESGRYESYGKEMLRFKDRHDRELLYGPTAEEVVVDIFRTFIKSYKDLPQCLYQIQWKFRDEIRPRFGVMRGREFLMKDAYSFDLDAESARRTYQRMLLAYLKTFKRMDLNAIPVRADTGPIGGDLSHEFHVLADTGESAIYYDGAFDDLCQQTEPDVEKIMEMYAMADEMHEADKCPVPQDRLKQRRGIEVGHIFNYGTKYAVSMKASVMDSTGAQVPTEGGCYGIGVSRLIGALIEVHHDEHGIIWPESVAPFHIGLINLKPADATCTKVADELYAALEKQGVEVLYDDRDQSAGAKFSTMDLIGLPYQIIIGPKGVAEGVLEVKNRKTQARENLSVAEVLNRFTSP